MMDDETRVRILHLIGNAEQGDPVPGHPGFYERPSAAVMLLAQAMTLMLASIPRPDDGK